ncbi:exosortase E/protease, VPEID-CTERM system [Shimia sp. R11_0]|uniref:exosortase E/protease, VPEID-CTERM system n=1 Tax=Shimia sp. R11_0 TaxID=2821096 RepID=UPI001ADBC122|nr:exosortase E/protease, VPEID-CTERM system [Shimia sp. R11_0]MBO9478924.1 exosortase E/protease, VPEID-CTERM system [Shimia sp. R11_0]
MSNASGTRRNFRLITATALAVAELLLVIVTYQVMASIECRLTEIETACRALRSMTARGLSVMAVMAIYFWLRPMAFRTLSSAIQKSPGHSLWMGSHIFGITLIFLPIFVFGAAEISKTFTPSLVLFLSGGLCAAMSLLLWVTPWKQWRRWMRSDSYLLPLALITGSLIPDLANLIRPAWELSALSSLTFFLVFICLSLWGFDVGVHPPTYEIGIKDFYVQIASQCSGVEGIALITMFMGIYALLMRSELRQNRFWLILFPLAVLTSWIFNILRIAILIVIGATVSPEHALNGFHSYAGWLMFTALALGVVFIADRASWLHRQTATTPSPRASLRQDDLALRIVPFITVMLSGVMASTFWQNPDDGYALRVGMMSAALWFFFPALCSLISAPRLASVLVGFCVGMMWVLTSAPSEAQSTLPTPTWITLRLIGTIFLVPVIEELFFRGYVLRRLNRGGIFGATIAVFLSSLLFGLMHERMLAGALAGVVFALLYMRQNRLSDAIVAHMSANATIAFVALWTAKWALI